MAAWLNDASYVVGGLVLTNAVPHLVSGLTGRPFQTPFAKPPGQGLSSSTVNVVWGLFNLVIAYVLICRVGTFDLHSNEDVLALGVGILMASVLLAQLFGRFHGGRSPGGG